MPLDTVLCLDTSGSMGWNNNEGINQLKAAALKFLEGVEETARQADLKVRVLNHYHFHLNFKYYSKSGLIILQTHKTGEQYLVYLRSRVAIFAYVSIPDIRSISVILSAWCQSLQNSVTSFYS